ncbi:MAG: AsmA family protein, partial [Pseudomonadota bacterium]
AQPVIKNGQGRIMLQRVALYDGTATGVMRVNASTDRFTWQTELNLEGMRARPFLTDLSSFDRIDGRANAKLDLRGRGPSQRAIVNSLNGTGAFRFTDGALIGVNIPQMLRGFQSGNLTNWETSETKQTDFTALTGTFNIDRGIVNNQDLSMVSPLLTVTGAGTVALPARQINYLAKPALVATLEGQGRGSNTSGLTVPVRVTGDLDNPNVSPDLSAMLQDPGAAAELLGQVTKQFGGNKQVEDGLRALRESGGGLGGLGGLLQGLGAQ